MHYSLPPFLVITREAGCGNAFSCVCLSCLCVCPVRTLTFESFDPESLFWYAGMSSKYLVKFAYRGHRVKVKVNVNVIGAKNGIYTFVGSAPSIGRQSSFYNLLLITLICT